MNAPIALFTFKRPHHTELALRSLLANPEIESSPLYIYCDGPRTAADEADILSTRKVVRTLAPSHAVIIERTDNHGLDSSIIAGVTDLSNRYGRVIVIEDDLEVAPNFLAYMNAALNRYESDSEVMQISGYQFPVSLPGHDAGVILPYTTSWGWATWQRAWQQFDMTVPNFSLLQVNAAQRRAFDLDGSYPCFKLLIKQLKQPFPAWDIVFYTNVFSMQGLVLHPRISLVRNNGFDGSGTHCPKSNIKSASFTPDAKPWCFPVRPFLDIVAYEIIKKHHRKEQALFRKIYRRIVAQLIS